MLLLSQTRSGWGGRHHAGRPRPRTLVAVTVPVPVPSAGAAPPRAARRPVTGRGSARRGPGGARTGHSRAHAESLGTRVGEHSLHG
ncbi:hypothetical protein NKH77_20870 [Streptomyces sp. M19]